MATRAEPKNRLDAPVWIGAVGGSSFGLIAVLEGGTTFAPMNVV